MSVQVFIHVCLSLICLSYLLVYQSIYTSASLILCPTALYFLCLSVCLSVCLYACRSDYIFGFHASSFVSVSMYLFIFFSSVYLSLSIPTPVSICLFAYHSICIYTCLFLCLCSFY